MPFIKLTAAISNEALYINVDQILFWRRGIATVDAHRLQPASTTAETRVFFATVSQVVEETPEQIEKLINAAVNQANCQFAALIGQAVERSRNPGAAGGWGGGGNMGV